MFFCKLDEQIAEKKPIKEINKDIHIFYYKFKGMGPVSDRDFVTVERMQFDNNK